MVRQTSGQASLVRVQVERSRTNHSQISTENQARSLVVELVFVYVVGMAVVGSLRVTSSTGL